MLQVPETASAQRATQVLASLFRGFGQIEQNEPPATVPTSAPACLRISAAGCSHPPGGREPDDAAEFGGGSFKQTAAGELRDFPLEALLSNPTFPGGLESRCADLAEAVGQREDESN